MPQEQEIDELILTAYALGELDGPDRADERAALESLLTGDALARRQVEEVRATAQWVSAELAAESVPGLSEIQHAAVERRLENAGDETSAASAALQMKPERRNWALWGSLAASVAIVCTVMASVLPKIYRIGADSRPGGGGAANPAARAGPLIVENPDVLAGTHDSSRPADTDGPWAQPESGSFPIAGPPTLQGENGFLRVADFPLSSVPATSAFPDAANKASVASIGRYLANSQLPPADSVRIDEIVNALPYHYATPEPDEAIGANLEVAGCPWNPSHRLLRIGLRTDDAPSAPSTNPSTLPSATSRGVAGLKVQVEFNPAIAGAYRLIGYETGPGADGLHDGTTDARPTGPLGAGRKMTALYETIPAGTVGPSAPLPPPLKYQKLTPVAESSHELATVTVRYRRASQSVATSRTLEFVATDDGRSFAGASEDFRTAAAAAALGMVLRSSPYMGTATYDLVIDTLASAGGSDPPGERAALLDLAKKAKAVASIPDKRP